MVVVVSLIIFFLGLMEVVYRPRLDYTTQGSTLLWYNSGGGRKFTVIL